MDNSIEELFDLSMIEDSCSSNFTYLNCFNIYFKKNNLYIVRNSMHFN
jgi:hypothetical protein